MAQKKELVTLGELSARLTSELQEVEDCEDSEITVKYRLKEPDTDGCNWSDDVSVRVGSKATSEYLQPHVSRIVHCAKSRYNVTD